MKKIIASALFVCILFLLPVHHSVSAQKNDKQPSFSDVTLMASSSHLLLFGMLDNAFTEQMVEGLHSGLPIHFSFFVELNQTDKSWKEEKMVTLETRHVISYDTLKESYKVEIEESGKRFFTFEKLADAQSMTNEINGLKVIELTKLTPETSYTLRVRAELYKKTLPMGLHEVVPFVSLWDLDTKWYNITFTL